MPSEVQIQCQTPFFIAFIGRSGSTHLLHLLNQHPDIKCFNEVFNPVAFWGKRGDRLERKIKRIVKKLMGRDRLIKRYLSMVYQKPSPACRGFEFKFNEHFEAFPDIHQWLKENNDTVKCLFLYRENNLRGALSLQNFKKIRKKHHTANLKQDSDIQVDFLEVDIDKAIEEILRREKLNREYFDRLSKEFDTHKVSYEDLVDNELGSLNKCFEFLGIQTISDKKFFVHKTRKISADRISDFVSNFDELYQRLQAENLGHYIEMDEK